MQAPFIPTQRGQLEPAFTYCVGCCHPLQASGITYVVSPALVCLAAQGSTNAGGPLNNNIPDVAYCDKQCHRHDLSRRLVGLVNSITA